MGVRPLSAKAVFLDRDGVINRAVVHDGRPFPPLSLEDLVILPGVPEALRLLKERGFLLIVVTNQPDVGRGSQKQETVEKIHTYLLKQLPLDDIFVCWHGQDGECNCRKPKPGLLLQAANKYGIDFENSFMIGDRWKDIEAGQVVGCTTIFIEKNYDELLRTEPNIIENNLWQSVKYIVKT